MKKNIKKSINKEIQEEIIELTPEEIRVKQRQDLEDEIVKFIGSLIGKSFMTSEQAKTFCYLYNLWLYKDFKTSDCRTDCSACMIKQFKVLKKVYTDYIERIK